MPFSKFPSPPEKLVSILTPCNYSPSSFPSPIAQIPYPRVTFVNEIALIAGIPQERILFESKHYASILDGKRWEKKRKEERNRIFALSFRFLFLLRSGQTRSIREITCPSTYPIHTNTHTHTRDRTTRYYSDNFDIQHHFNLASCINCPINTPDPAAARTQGGSSNYKKQLPEK